MDRSVPLCAYRLSGAAAPLLQDGNAAWDAGYVWDVLTAGPIGIAGLENLPRDERETGQRLGSGAGEPASRDSTRGEAKVSGGERLRCEVRSEAKR